jgi:molecular chaperone GrpE
MTEPVKQRRSKKTSDSSRLDELTNDLQRIQADFVNYKRRAEEDVSRAVSLGRESSIKALLPTIDNIERALAHVPDDLADHEFIKALVSVAKKMQADLRQFGLEKIPTLDEEFNPELMEAVQMDDGDGDHEVVVEELQSGYIFNGQVIRHAMVKVGKR